MNLPWTSKYKPGNSSKIPQPTAVLQIRNFLNNFKKEKKKALLLHGPSGSCKTSSVYAIAEEQDLEIIEINASDFRNKGQVYERIGGALKQHSLFKKWKLVLVDEVDGLAGNEDRGGVAALTQLISETNFPIILTANNPWDPQFSSLRTKSTLIKFSSLSYPSIFNILKNICEKEGIAFSINALKELSKKGQGDLRAAINDLQSLASVRKEIDEISVGSLNQRNRVEGILYAVSKMFKTVDVNESIRTFDDVEEDFDKRILWIDENLPKEYKNPRDLARAYESLSRADIFKSRIIRWQHWRFLSYVNTSLTAGVSVAKDREYPGFTRISPPSRILKIWRANAKYQKRKSIAQKLSKKTHCSTKKAMQSLFYIKNSLTKNERMINELGLDADEIKWLNS